MLRAHICHESSKDRQERDETRHMNMNITYHHQNVVLITQIRLFFHCSRNEPEPLREIYAETNPQCKRLRWFNWYMKRQKFSDDAT